MRRGAYSREEGEERWGLQRRNPGFRDRTEDEEGKDLLALHG
jgi:hypothetical protein